MTRIIWAAILLIVGGISMAADEGMWTFDNCPACAR